MKLRTLSVVHGLALLGYVAAVPVRAQTAPAPTKADSVDATAVQLERLRARLVSLEELDLDPIEVVSPGSSSNTPVARGSARAAVGVWMSFQARTRYTRRADGAVGVGVGFGDPRKTLRYQGGVAILDLGHNGEGAFASRGSFNSRVTRSLPRGYAISVGVENAFIWGFSDVPTSGYVVVGNTLPLRSDRSAPFGQLAWSAGVGTGRYRTEKDIWANRGMFNLFGSVATRVAKPASVFAEWSGQDANVGISVAPLRELPFAISGTVVDILGTAGDGARLTVGAGYRFAL